jgi:hypothetical protein
MLPLKHGDGGSRVAFQAKDLVTKVSTPCDLEHSFLVKELLNQDSLKEIVTQLSSKRKGCDGRNT